MRKKIIITTVVLVVIVVSAFAFSKYMETRAEAKKYEYFGRTLTPAELEEVTRQNEKAREAFPETVRKLNKGWDLISTGHKHMRDGNLSEAIQAYKKAYETDPRNGLTSHYLMEAYEKNEQYVEAVAVIDEILESGHLAEIGIKRYSEHRERLTQLIEASNAK